MGGNTYNRRHFTDEEINELVRQVDGTSEWARQNQYCLILADQEYFRQKTELINLEEFDINTQRKLRNLLS